MTIPAHLDTNLYLQQSADGHAHDGNELLADFVSKINEIIDALTSGGTIGDITEIVAGVNLDGGGDTGVVTIDMAPYIDLAGASEQITITARKAAAGQTDNNGAAIFALNNGTYDAGSTGSNLQQYGIWSQFSGSKSAGSDTLEGWGLFGNATGTPDIAIGSLGWAHSSLAGSINYGVFGQASNNATGTMIGVVGYAGHGNLTKFAPDPGDVGNEFSGIFRGGTLKSESDFWHTGTNAGFFSATPTTKPEVTGSRNGNAALASALTGLAGLGLLTDSSTAGTAGISYQVGYYSDAGANAIDPGDTTAIIANITGEGGSTFSLAAGTTEGHSIQIILESGAATATTAVTCATLDDSEAGTTMTFPHTAPASITLTWSETNQLWYVVSLRNVTIA